MRLRIAVMFATAFCMNAVQSTPIEFIDTYYQWFELASPPAERKQLTQLLLQAEQYRDQFENNAEAWLACGLVRAGYAKSIGGLGGLSHLRKARRELERSMELDRYAVGAAAASLLGRLYTSVPGWPLAFGSDTRAEAILSQAMADNPSALLPRYYYALLLIEKGQLDSAEALFNEFIELTLPCNCKAWESAIRRDVQIQLNNF